MAAAVEADHLDLFAVARIDAHGGAAFAEQRLSDHGLAEAERPAILGLDGRGLARGAHGDTVALILFDARAFRRLFRCLPLLGDLLLRALSAEMRINRLG